MLLEVGASLVHCMKLLRKVAMFKKRQMTAEELDLARSNEQQGYKDLDRKYYDHIQSILKKRTIETVLPPIRQKVKRHARANLLKKNSELDEDSQMNPRSPWISQSVSIIGTPEDSNSSENQNQVKRSEFFKPVTSIIRKMKQSFISQRWTSLVGRCHRKRRSLFSKDSKPPDTCASLVPDSSEKTKTVNLKEIIAVDRLTSKLHRFKDVVKLGRSHRRVSEESIVDEDAEEHELAMHLRWLAHQHRTNPMLFARYGTKESYIEEVKDHKPSSNTESESSSWETDTSASSDSEDEDEHTPAGFTTSLYNFETRMNTRSKEFSSCPSISISRAIEATQIEKSENFENSVILTNENVTSMKTRARSLCAIEDSPNLVKRVASCPTSQYGITTKLYEIDAATSAEQFTAYGSVNEVLYETGSSKSSVNSADS